MIKITCSICGCWKQFSDNVDIPEIQKWDFIVWGINEDGSYFTCCVSCMGKHNDSSRGSVSSRKNYKVKNHKKKKVDTREIILYREI